MNLEVWERDLGDDGLEAYYTEHPRPSLVAVEQDLSRVEKEARVVEATGYGVRRPKGGRKYCYGPRWEHDYDPNAINAIRCVVGEIRPSWVEEVRKASLMSNNTRWIAGWCELSEQVVIAILCNLRDSGQLPEELEEA